MEDTSHTTLMCIERVESQVAQYLPRQREGRREESVGMPLMQSNQTLATKHLRTMVFPNGSRVDCLSLLTSPDPPQSMNPHKLPRHGTVTSCSSKYRGHITSDPSRNLLFHLAMWSSQGKSFVLQIDCFKLMFEP